MLLISGARSWGGDPNCPNDACFDADRKPADGVIFANPGGIGYFACRQEAAISAGIAAGDGLEPPEAWTE